MIYLLYFIIFWLILPAILYFPAIYLLDPLISIHTLKFIYFDFFKIAPFILILGIIIYLSAFIELYKQGHGLPVSAKPPVYLVETGCYFWFRHPLYIGFQFILISLALFTGSLGFLITTGPLFLVLWVLYACIEERGLTRRHGDAYARYRKETGLIFQSMYNIARLILIPVFRIIFRLIFAGASVIPKQGGFYLVSLHRSYPSQATAAIVYLMLYPKPPIERALLDSTEQKRRVWELLNEIRPKTMIGEGRVYGGGLHKLEPRELGNVPAKFLLDLLPNTSLPRRVTQLEFFAEA